jgi:hypothetical protein
MTIWPDAPVIEVAKAAMLCAQYHLNPLKKHIFLIGYYNKKTGKKDWSTQIGISAVRLMAVRKGTFSYLDDSPRIMSEAEQMKIYGDIAHDRIRAITILRDEKTGAMARGYGHWMLTEEPKGTEKGNSKANMAFKRSEAQAIDRLRPGEMPPDVEVTDEQYMPSPVVSEVKASPSTNVRTVDPATGEITEGQYTEGPPEQPTDAEVEQHVAEVTANTAQQQTPVIPMPTTIQELCVWAKAIYGIVPSEVAKDAGCPTSLITDIPKVVATIKATRLPLKDSK